MMGDKIRVTGVISYLLCLLAANTVSAQPMGRYSTNLLQSMAGLMNLTDTLYKLPTGIHRDYCSFNGNSVTVITRNNQVEHIGYTIFALQQRESMPSPIYNFLERYALEMDLPRNGKWNVARQMEIDHVTFMKGSLLQLPSLCNDTTLTVTISNHSERAYTVEWLRDSVVVCSVFFPSDYELMHGIDMIEKEDRVRGAIESSNYTELTVSVSKDNLEKITMPQGDYYVLERGINRIPEMPSNVYYQLVSDPVIGTDSLQLLCSVEFPVESVANLFSSLEIENDYEVELKLNKYNFKKEIFRVPLRQLVRFCLSENCRPYFGVIRYDVDNHLIDAFMEMRNHEEAYEHLLRIKMDTSTLAERKGLINVTLTSYVLTHNVENLYYDK